MIRHQHLRVPRRRHKERVHPASNRRHEDLTHLQPDEEGESHHNRCVSPGSVVSWVCEFQVEEGEEGAEESDKGGAHGEDGADEAVIDEGVDAAVFHHSVGRMGIRALPLVGKKGREQLTSMCPWLRGYKPSRTARYG